MNRQPSQTMNCIGRRGSLVIRLHHNVQTRLQTQDSSMSPISPPYEIVAAKFVCCCPQVEYSEAG